MKKETMTQKGQSAVELAILGSIILFILGILLRYGINFADSQNVQYKAFRQALKMSGEDAYNPYPAHNDPVKPKGARISSTTIWIEDRPTVQGGEKYGSSTRTPYMAHGSGVFSTLMQIPLAYDEWEGLPVIDMYINGQHFIFRTAWFRRFCMADQSKCNKIKNYINVDKLNNVVVHYDDEVEPLFPHYFFSVRKPYITIDDLSKIPHPWLNNSVEDWNTVDGLRADRAFFTKITRTNEKFCFASGSPPGHLCHGILPQELNRYRFNLRGESVDDVNPVDYELREKMTWQWYPVAFSNIGIDLFDKAYLQLDLTGDLKQETILKFQSYVFLPNDKMEIHSFSPFETYYKGWFKDPISDDYYWTSMEPPDPSSFLDHGYTNISEGPFWPKLPVDYVELVDYQYGDWDTTYNQVDEIIFRKRPPGLIQEGSRIQASSEAVFQQRQTMQGDTRASISSQERIAVDLIERRVRLSRNTGCFCPAQPAAGNGMEHCLEDAGHDETQSGIQLKPYFCREDNIAVEVYCRGHGCCNSDEGYERRPSVTCLEYDEGEDPQNPYDDELILYVRSGLGTQEGYKTITEEEIEEFSY